MTSDPFFVKFFVFFDHRLYHINYGISEHAVYRLNTLLLHDTEKETCCPVPENNLKVVIVHDAARPLVPSELVEELVIAAEEHGAAGAIRPLVSTVLQANSDGFLDHSLDRSKHVSSETPQAFQFDILTSAYNKVCFLLLIVMVCMGE